MRIGIVLTGLLVFLLVGCNSNQETIMPTGTPKAVLDISSTAFVGQQPIPKQYSCDGRNISPPLQWGEPPTGTQSFALVMDDPDAPSGTFVHWVLYALPSNARSLAEAVPANASLADGSRQGQNGAGRTGYTGPCPPGGTHNYFFKLYALDTKLDLAPGASKEQLMKAIEDHVLAYGQLVGTYSR